MGFAMFAFYGPVFFLCFIIISFFSSMGKKRKLQIQRPPCPLELPIIGHLHLLNLSSIARSFAELATRYGPIMRLQVVSRSCVIVSNATIAREIMKDNEMHFMVRPDFGCSGYNIYDGYSFIFAEYGEYWRFMKKLCMTELLSVAQVKHFSDIQRDEKMKFLETLVKCSEEGRVCHMGAEFLKMTNNMTCRMMMSTRCSGSQDESMMIRNLIKEIQYLTAKFSLGEILFGRTMNRIGFFYHGRQMKSLLLQFDALVEKIIAEHEKEMDFGKKERKDIVDLLLQMYKDDHAETTISRMHIKTFL